MTTIFPRPLRQGDKIAILSPASIIDPALVDGAAKAISAQGWEPVVMPHATGRHGTYSGSADDRADRPAGGAGRSRRKSHTVQPRRLRNRAPARPLRRNHRPQRSQMAHRIQRHIGAARTVAPPRHRLDTCVDGPPSRPVSSRRRPQHGAPESAGRRHRANTQLGSRHPQPPGIGHRPPRRRQPRGTRRPHRHTLRYAPPRRHTLHRGHSRARLQSRANPLPAQAQRRTAPVARIGDRSVHPVQPRRQPPLDGGYDRRDDSPLRLPGGHERADRPHRRQHACSPVGRNDTHSNRVPGHRSPRCNKASTTPCPPCDASTATSISPQCIRLP